MRLFKILILFCGFSTQCLANNADTTVILRHLRAIINTPNYRSFDNVEQLNITANYIDSIFKLYSQSVEFQPFVVNEQIYKNVICSFGTENSKRIVIGGHYDVCGHQSGADDNASGVVALLELARLLQSRKLKYRVDLVAYSLEEPPFFRTKSMGSYVHAQSLFDQKVDVYGMLSVEMIGYFKDEKHSQRYPMPLLSWFYGNRGNYITLVKRIGSGTFARRFGRKFSKTKTIVTKKIIAPRFLAGIDFSDHLNYWKLGYSALMITDTSFYRNTNYHESTDTIETLDLHRMSKTIDGILGAILEL